MLKPATYDTQRAPLPYRIRYATLTQHTNTTSNVIRRRPHGARALVAYARLRFPVGARASVCVPDEVYVRAQANAESLHVRLSLAV